MGNWFVENTIHSNEENNWAPGETSQLFICTSLTRCVASMVSPDGAMDSTPTSNQGDVGSSPAQGIKANFFGQVYTLILA